MNEDYDRKSLEELGFDPDRIGQWSEIKLELIERYAKEYSAILSKQNWANHSYIDAFSGGGKHIRKRDGQLVDGGPLQAMKIEPPFKAFFFIDLKATKSGHLEKLIGDDPRVSVFTGDCNEVLKQILPGFKKSDGRRALCILDPYGIHYAWEVVKLAAKMETVELFLNFSIMDINRTAIRDRLDQVNQNELDRMNSFWGDSTWQDLVYYERHDLFGHSAKDRKRKAHQVLPSEYRKRLKEVAGFKYVPEPVPFLNSKGGLLYYLFFASHKQVAAKIVKHIFEKFGKEARK